MPNASYVDSRYPLINKLLSDGVMANSVSNSIATAIANAAISSPVLAEEMERAIRIGAVKGLFVGQSVGQAQFEPLTNQINLASAITSFLPVDLIFNLAHEFGHALTKFQFNTNSMAYNSIENYTDPSWSGPFDINSGSAAYLKSVQDGEAAGEVYGWNAVVSYVAKNINTNPSLSDIYATGFNHRSVFFKNSSSLIDGVTAYGLELRASQANLDLLGSSYYQKSSGLNVGTSSNPVITNYQTYYEGGKIASLIATDLKDIILQNTFSTNPPTFALNFSQLVISESGRELAVAIYKSIPNINSFASFTVAIDDTSRPGSRIVISFKSRSSGGAASMTIDKLGSSVDHYTYSADAGLRTSSGAPVSSAVSGDIPIVQPTPSHELALAAAMLGSTLGRLIAGNDLILATLSGSVLSAVALTAGEFLFSNRGSGFPGSSPGEISKSIWNDFTNNLASFGSSAALGSVSSYLATELGQAAGLSGFGGQLFSSVTGNVLQYAATRLANGATVGNMFKSSASGSLGGSLTSGIAGFIGTELAQLVVTPHTVAEATLASLGAAAGGFVGGAIGGLYGLEAAINGSKIGAAIAGPIGIAIGAFVGFILGDLFGSLFGHHKPRIPTASAETVLQVPYAQYALGAETAANGGDLQLADAMAKAARDTLNGLIAQITHGQKPAYVSNTYSPTQIYGHSGNQVYVKLGGVQNNVSSANQAVDKGVLWALPQTKIIGGDLILKRAVQNGAWSTVTEMLGDLQIAADYETYLDSKPVIDAAIGSSWNSLSATDQTFYTANKAFMTRAISATQLPLTGSDVNFYNANKTQVDRIIGSISVSSFAAGWIVTLARAAELKLDQFGPSDFFGGLQGFLQSFNINSTGTAVHFEDVSARMVNNDLKVSAAGAAAAGTFSLLPQASATGDAVTIGNFASVMGYFVSDGAWGPSGGNDLITASKPIVLANASFESTSLAPNQPVGYVTGWTTTGNTETWHPVGQINATDGVNVMNFNPTYGLGQATQQAGTFIAGQTYTLSVDLGVRNDVTTYGSLTLSLGSDLGTVATALSPAFYPWGKMHTATLAYTATSTDAGRPIFVKLTGNGSNQINVDNVRLDVSAATVIPLANPSFENPWHADGAWSGGIPGWSGAGDFGTQNFTGQMAATEGDNVAYLNPHVAPTSIWQQAGVLETGKTYTFSVDAGVRNDINNAATATVMFSTNAVNLVQNSVALTAVSGTTQRISVSYTENGANAGAPLFVTVSATSSSQVEVDNARLISTSGVTVDVGWPEMDFGSEGYYPATNTGDDIIIGGDGADNLNAGVGNDWIEGGSGNDVIVGGSGRDVLLGGDGNDNVMAGDGDTYLSGGRGTDTLTGGGGNDTLVGGDGTDTIHAGGGNDTIIVDPDGGAVWDYLDGGNGIDTVTYERFTAGIALDMWNGQGGGYTSQFYGDGLVSIENVTGTNFDDVIYGNDSGNVLMGLAGNDIIAARPGDDILEGGAGADYLNGDAGVNATSYEHSSSGVYVNLWTGTAIGGDATGDSFDNIQNIIGSAFADELQGSLYTSSIKAGAGDDWVDGTRSNPGLVIDGGDGFDTMDYSQDNFQEGAGSALGGDPNAYYYYGGIIPALSVAVTGSGTVAYYRDGDGYQSSQALVSVEQVLGTQRNDLFTNSTNIGVTWDGRGGADVYHGGTGSDTYVFGRGYGTDSIYDDKSASNTVKFDASVTFDDLLVVNDAGAGLHFIIRGTSDELIAYNDWNPQIGNDVVKTLDLSGAAHVDLTQVCGTVVGDDNANTLGGNASYYLISWGYGGNDTISPANGNYSTLGSIVAGGLGNDTINTSVGDDQFLFERGDGHDVINDGGGQNTIIFGPTVGANDVLYKVVGNDLYIGIKDLSNTALDATQVADNIKISGGGVQYVDVNTGSATFNTVFSVEAGGATTALAHANIAWTTQPGWSGGYYFPVVLDLNGDGLEITPVAQSDIVTKDAMGNVLRTGWVGPTNGILAFDRNGDGKISNTGDISFVQDKPGAQTDLEGLSGWDSNGDGVLDARDANFSKLVIWTDRNVDGRAGSGEVKSLDQLGIQSIALTPKPTGFDGSDTIDTIVRNTTTFTRTDGTTGMGYDVAFARQLLTGPVATDEARSIDSRVVSEFGRLENDPLALATDARAVAAVQKAGGKAGGLAAVSALAEVNQSDTDKSISAASAARWADYLDPVKIAARKAMDATRVSGTQNIEAIRNSTAYQGGLNPYLKPSIPAGAATPHVLVVDFNHDGPSLIAPAASRAGTAMSASGQAKQIGWVSPSDGILAYDGNGDGRVDPKSEISFDQISAGGQTGLAALKVYDTNGDGILNSADNSFVRFLIWRDANGDGASRPDELVTLQQAGISSLNLATAKLHVPSSVDGSVNNVVGVGEVDFADGSSRALYDVALGDTASKDLASAQQTSSAGNAESLLQAATTAGQIVPESSLPYAASPSTSLQDSSGLTSVGRASGTLAGPDGVVVQSASAGQDDTQWWRDAGIVGTTLANLASPLAPADTALAADSSSVTDVPSVDAATLQRLMLLRQNMAGQGGSSGGDAAVWARGTADDAGAALAVNNDAGLTTFPRPPLAA